MTQAQQDRIESKINELAEQVIPDENFESFKSLDIKGKLTGIAVLAHISGETKIAAEATEILESI